MTVALAVNFFVDRYPGALIIIQGSTPSRTRFYSIAILKYLNEIAQNFEIWGALSENDWEPFKRNKSYKMLLAKRKRIF